MCENVPITDPSLWNLSLLGSREVDWQRDTARVLHIIVVSVTVLGSVVALGLDFYARCRGLWHISWPLCVKHASSTASYTPRYTERFRVWATVASLRLAIAAPLGHKPHDIALVSKRHLEDLPSNSTMLLDRVAVANEYHYLESLSFAARWLRTLPAVHPVLRDFLFSYVQSFILRIACSLMELWAGLLIIAFTVAVFTQQPTKAREFQERGAPRSECGGMPLGPMGEALIGMSASFVPMAQLQFFRRWHARDLVHTEGFTEEELQRMLRKWRILDGLVMTTGILCITGSIVFINVFLDVADKVHERSYAHMVYWYLGMAWGILPAIQALLIAQIVSVFVRRHHGDPFRRQVMVKLCLPDEEKRPPVPGGHGPRHVTGDTKQSDKERTYQSAQARATRMADRKAQMEMEEAERAERAAAGATSELFVHYESGNSGQSPHSISSRTVMTPTAGSRNAQDVDLTPIQSEAGDDSHLHAASTAASSERAETPRGNIAINIPAEVAALQAQVADLQEPRRKALMRLSEVRTGNTRLRAQISGAREAGGGFDLEDDDAESIALRDKEDKVRDVLVAKFEMQPLRAVDDAASVAAQLRWHWLSLVEALRECERIIQQIEAENVALRQEWLEAAHLDTV